ncbi:hypothetical protein [Dysgonomonas termitidis]|uniref:Uncharacterized protein n=1 Tax=Dysgonomonas termitidis TaxID=1516126 RepID=A0ABV9L3S0_9BACT
MKLLTFIFSHEQVFRAVKQESSQLAVRRQDKNGNPLFEQLVFDEAYLPRFRELFFHAQGQVAPVLAAYQKDIPVNVSYFERADFTTDRDYIVYLGMDDDFNMHMARPVEDYIFHFIKDWIMYEWLKDKSPDDASVYLAGTGKYRTDIMIGLAQKINVRRRRGYWF